MPKRFEGKVALVTGAAAGIGRAVATGLAREGASVVVSDIAIENGKAVVAEIEAEGGRAIFHRANATVDSDVAALVAACVKSFGGLDIAFNNVGFARGSGIEELTEQAWDQTIDLCLKAPWLCLKHELPALTARGGGVIVNTASMAGLRYAESANIAYAAAKAGLIHMTRYAAVAWAARGIRVNAVSPGLTRTAAVAAFMTPEQQALLASATQPIGRIVEPHEVADTVLFLCSDAAAMVTGENIAVAGGHQAT
jgi:NAD(P)-dependent dehydrogenase (short-subunit alcohol dehydrogenase family)